VTTPTHHPLNAAFFAPLDRAPPGGAVAVRDDHLQRSRAHEREPCVDPACGWPVVVGIDEALSDMQPAGPLLGRGFDASAAQVEDVRPSGPPRSTLTMGSRPSRSPPTSPGIASPRCRLGCSRTGPTPSAPRCWWAANRSGDRQSNSHRQRHAFRCEHGFCSVPLPGVCSPV